MFVHRCNIQGQRRPAAQRLRSKAPPEYLEEYLNGKASGLKRHGSSCLCGRIITHKPKMLFEPSIFKDFSTKDFVQRRRGRERKGGIVPAF
jgi:hypothetical protein